jgi:hypothetical protein
LLEGRTAIQRNNSVNSFGCIDHSPRVCGFPGHARRAVKGVQERGETRGRELIREATLREVREAVKRTQVAVAAAKGASQDRVSKLEHGDDELVSTLRRLGALGGELRLMAEFPDRPSMAIDLRGDKPIAESVRAIGQI